MDDETLFPEIATFRRIVLPITSSTRSRRKRMAKKAKRRLMKLGVDEGAVPSDAPPISFDKMVDGFKGEDEDVPPPSSHHLTLPPSTVSIDGSSSIDSCRGDLIFDLARTTTISLDEVKATEVSLLEKKRKLHDSFNLNLCIEKHMYSLRPRSKR